MEKKLVEMMNHQINQEFYSAYLYLDIALYFKKMSLDGYYHWYMLQAQEEQQHALEMIDFVDKNDEEVLLQTIHFNPPTYKDVKGALELAHAHEKSVTTSIHKIYAHSLDVKDYKTTQFLDKFIAEQVEEEATSLELIKRFELFGESKRELYLLDQEMGQRVNTGN